MTHNKSDKNQNRQNHSGYRSAKINMTKFASRPPSLNGIRKHLP